MRPQPPSLVILIAPAYYLSHIYNQHLGFFTHTSLSPSTVEWPSSAPHTDEWCVQPSGTPCASTLSLTAPQLALADPSNSPILHPAVVVSGRAVPLTQMSGAPSRAAPLAPPLSPS